MQEKEDRRIYKTKKQLRLALAELLKNKKLADITISEITESADLNRGTFYLHYKDIYDFMDSVKADFINEISCILDRHSPKIMKTNIYPMLLEIFKYINSNREICEIALSSGSNSDIAQSLMNLFRIKCFSDWDEVFSAADKSNYEIFYNFLSSGFVGIVQYWISNDFKEKPSEMALMTTKMMLSSATFINNN